MPNRPPESEMLTLKAIVGDATVSVVDALRRIDDAKVAEADFAHEHTRALFAGVVAVMRNGRMPETVALTHALGERVPRALVADVMVNWELGVSEDRLKTVRERGLRRQLRDKLQAALAIVSAGANYAAAHGEALKLLGELDQPTTELRTLQSESAGIVDEVQAVYEGRAESTLRTGIPKLDETIGGLQPTLTILGAEPGAGKSGLMLRIIRNLAERGVTSGVFSLEDQARWMVRRMAAETSGLPVFVLQNRKLTDHQLERFGGAMNRIHELAAHVLVDDRKGLDAKTIAASARTMIANGAKAIFVDHLGEVRVNRTERHDRDIGDVLRELRGIADVHRVPIVVLCHVKRREGVAEEPRITDFAFSADVERTARVALAVVKPDEDTQGVHVLKQTSGVSGVAMWLRFNGPAAMSTNDEAAR
jgi:replicative DNA helicase